jgi:glycerate-2-kinase
MFNTKTSRESAEQIFMAGIRGVLPGRLIMSHLSFAGEVLKAGGHEIPLGEIDNIYVIGAGKASAAMAHYMESLLGDCIKSGHIIVKYGYSCSLNNIKVTEAGHPLPDLNGFMATEEILRIAGNAMERDLVIGLFSGGGSALLTDIPKGLLPEDIIIINNLLIRCGADIKEINTVRKHLSLVKGGQLARAIMPAKSLNLLLSDVIGDQPEIIASGPTAPDTSTFGEAMNVLEKYNLTGDVTAGILNFLNDGIEGKRPETLRPDDPAFKRTLNIIAGTNRTALKAAKAEAEELGFNTIIVDSALQGDVENVSQYLIDKAMWYKNDPGIPKPVCLLFGGESTLRVAGNGTGGRNQHLALLTAMKLQECSGITVLTAGTDGNDGPTNAAGAIVDSATFHLASSLNVDASQYLAEFDSYNFFKATDGLVITGPTMTNVMDLAIVIVE